MPIPDMSHLLAIVLDSVVLLALVIAVSFLLRRASASVRHQLLLGAFVGLLLLPAFSIVMPSWSLPVGPRIAAPAKSAGIPNGRTAAPTGPAAEDAGAAAPTVRSLPPATQTTARDGASAWLRWSALALWALGALVILLVQLIRWVHVGSIADLAARLETGRAATIAHRIRNHLGIRRPVTLLRSEMAAVTMVWGLRHPVIILPAESADWSEKNLTAVLHHELMHIQRSDNLVHLLAVLACALYWFNPLVWISLRRLHLEREVACDDSVLNAGTRASAYARHLMEVTMSLNTTRSQRLVPAVMASSSDIKRRLHSILSPETDRRPLARAAAVICLAAVLGLTLPLAGFRPRAEARAATDGAPKVVVRAVDGGTMEISDVEEVVEVLEVLRRAEDPDADQTPLHVAATYGHADLARILLADGADVHARDRERQTPLHKAAVYGHLRVARLLIDAAADPTATDREGQTPLHKAAIYGHAGVAGLLLKQDVDVHAGDRNEQTPLLKAAIYGHEVVTELLIEAGADVRAGDDEHQTALHKTAIYGHAKLAQRLIAAGAEVNVRDRDGQTPLHKTAIYGHHEVSDLLLDHGAEVNAVDREGQTPLHKAAVYGHVRVVRQLIGSGADVNRRDDEGYRPLHEAVVYGHEDVYRLLRENHAE